MEKDPIVCYECKKSGHIKYECPLLKKQNEKKPKKKAIMATWSNSDDSNDDDSYNGRWPTYVSWLLKSPW
ncbi:hypothetical protein DITRI_Ditri01bG0147100 [Diplodiscus trichospermus]